MAAIERRGITKLATSVAFGSGGNNIDSSAVDPVTGQLPYGGDLSKPGRFEGGEWVND
jgi:hypothetical protein